MENLTQSQIVLLCLLTSFVTSIGTGIITVSLLQEAPQTVTQTINRVVERTVETITPQPTEKDSKPGIVTREVTVVVKEEELVIDAISKSRSSLVRIYKNSSRGDPEFESVGVVVKSNGTILADKRVIRDDSENSYSAVFFSGGESVPMKVAETSEKTNAVFLVPSESAASRTYVPATLGNSDAQQLGQTVIAMGGKDKEAVTIGRLSSVNLADARNGAENASTTSSSVVSLETDTPLRDSAPGSILLNLSGLLVGFENYTATQNIETLYTAINEIKRENPTYFDSVTI